jgi:hypothetical protein
MRRCSPWPAGAAFPAALVLAVIAGCGGPGSSPSASAPAAPSAAAAVTGRPCGTSRTAAGVPVVVQVARGTVGCAAAMQVERGYAAALASGRAPGNGGGGPVPVQGWVCSGFDTPEILRTGTTSRCVRGTAEIVAVLPSPSASPAS